MHKKIFFQIILAGIIYLCIIAWSVSLAYRTGLGPESEIRIPQVLDNRPFVTKVFDVEVNDFGLYQGRELSYVFEIADVYFIRYCARLGFPHFLSITHYVSLFMFALVTVIISAVLFKQKNLAVPILLGALFLTAPASFLGVFFNRNSKELVALFLGILFYVTHPYLMEKKSGRFRLFLLFTIAFLTTILDRQGFFIMVWCMYLSLLLYVFTRSIHDLKLFVVFMAAVGANCIYNYVTGPYLIHTYAGYWPDFGYQAIDIRILFEAPEILRQALAYTAHTASFLFGNLNGLLLAPLISLLVYLFYNALRHVYPAGNRKYTNLIVYIILSSFLSVFVLNVIMLMRLNWIGRPDVERLYYSLPVYAIMIIALNYIFAYCNNAWKKSWIVCAVALMILVVSNMRAVPQHLFIIRSGYLYAYFRDTPFLLDCIKNKNVSIASFALPSPENEKVCEVLR